MRRKKRILICDDDKDQYKSLEGLLKKNNYEVFRSIHYDKVVQDLENYGPIQLLILDLGFRDSDKEEKFVGQKCLPNVTDRFPDLKIIIYSKILQDTSKFKEASEIIKELHRFPQVKSLLYPGLTPLVIEFEINKIMGMPNWLIDDEIWILHVSDLQAGGSGLVYEGAELAIKIWETIESFVQTAEHDDKTGKLNYPAFAFITGDLTQQGRPSEFEIVSKFIRELALKISERRPEMFGILDKHNCIIVPGNHDMSWDISRSRNIWFKEDKNGKKSYILDVGNEMDPKFNPALDFLQEYCWLSFSKINFGLLEDKKDWCWDPGYHIIDLRMELGIIIVLLNSSRWRLHHIVHKGNIPQNVWNEIQKELSRLDRDRIATRILVVHHSLCHSNKPEDMLNLDEYENDQNHVIQAISRTCGFSIVFTGHMHKLAADDLSTGNEKRSLIHIGAGTIRSDDHDKYRYPGFNLIKISDRETESNRFKNVTVFPFHWNDGKFCRHTAFGDGMKMFKKFELKYG